MSEKATFGAGCFWGVEAAFREIPGVLDAAVGYEGGHTVNPTYKDICTDMTGHVEVVEVDFDPSKVNYRSILQAFFELHDPTQVNRQGPDVGMQYRSVVFYHSADQQQLAQDIIRELNAAGKFRKPIATQVEPAKTFYRAEEYHQQYLAKRGLRHCHV